MRKFPWYLFFIVFFIMFISISLSEIQNNLISKISILASFMGGMYYMNLVSKEIDRRRNK